MGYHNERIVNIGLMSSELGVIQICVAMILFLSHDCIGLVKTYLRSYSCSSIGCLLL